MLASKNLYTLVRVYPKYSRLDLNLPVPPLDYYTYVTLGYPVHSPHLWFDFSCTLVQETKLSLG